MTSTNKERQGQRERSRRPVSMMQVAEAAGVSHQTVSRVINGHPYVSADTRQRVASVIEHLGYRPNGAAQALATGRQKSVTVLTSNTTLYGYAATIRGVEEAARTRGLAVGIRVLDAEPESTVKHLSADSGNLIVAAYDSAGWRALRALSPNSVHAGVVGRSFPESGRGKADPRWAWLDDRAAAADATRYLLELGHPTVHHVPIPAWAEDHQRQGGWRDALLMAGAPVPPVLPAGWDAPAGYRAGRQLSLDPSVTAVLCGNDDLAIGVIRAFHEAHLRVPQDISVIGFDDAPNSQYLAPSLASVHLDFVGLGHAALNLLWEQLTDAPPRPARAARPELLVRESVGPVNLARRACFTKARKA